MNSEEQYIQCDNCCVMIPLREVQLQQEIVTVVKKEKRHTAVCYYFVCPMCYHRYNCFYKDKEVNKLFAEDKQEEAQKRMEDLWEIFENE